MGMIRYTVAISSDFFKAYAKLPRQAQSRVISLVTKFRENPTQPGLNYEKLNYIDPKLVSLRVNDNYRCIVMNAEYVYVLLWVDAHDEAYEWARKRKCTVDATTGALQILVVREETEEKEKGGHEYPKQEELCPWADYPDERFELLGIPTEYRARLRTLPARNLEEYNGCFSSLTWECLHFLLQGDPWQDVESILLEAHQKEIEKDQTDEDDIRTALDSPASRSLFMVDPDESELEAAFEKPLEQWRIFLHPAQYALVKRDWNGSVKVLGGAGTGKTVCAMHRARWLAARCPKDEKILFTTFSTTLADDLRQNMTTLCSPEEMSRIEIINLDRWVYAYLKRENFHYRFCDEHAAGEIWKQVVPYDSKFDRDFYRDEWKKVIQPQEITRFEEYACASRTGRKKAITRAERRMIWPVFEDFRILMREHGLLEQEDALCMARERVKANGNPLYFSVVVDEAQDMSIQALKLLRVLVKEGKNDMFVVGDAHQRIYSRHPVPLRACAINITGRSRKLRINYRTTEEIRRKAVSYLEGVGVDDLDGGCDGNGGYVSLVHGPDPVQVALAAEKRTAFIAATVAELKKNGIEEKDICLTLFSNKEIAQYERDLSALGVPTCCLSSENSDDRTKEGVRLATRHRVKGLEFSAVILADWKTRGAQEECFLRYVAATRARKYLCIITDIS